MNPINLDEVYLFVGIAGKHLNDLRKFMKKMIEEDYERSTVVVLDDKFYISFFKDFNTPDTKYYINVNDLSDFKKKETCVVQFYTPTFFKDLGGHKILEKSYTDKDCAYIFKRTSKQEEDFVIGNN